MTAEGELIAAPSSAQRRHLGTEHLDVRVGYVKLSGGQAGRLGVRIGDRLLEVGGEKLRPLDAAETGTALTRRVAAMGRPLVAVFARPSAAAAGRVSVAEAAKARLHGRRTMAQTLADARAVFERRSKQTAGALQARRRRRRQEQQAAEEGSSNPQKQQQLTDSSPISVAVGEFFGRPPTTTALGISRRFRTDRSQDRSGVGPAPRFQEPLRQSELRIINGRRHASETLSAARAEFEERAAAAAAAENNNHSMVTTVAVAPRMMLAPSSSASPSSSLAVVGDRTSGGVRYWEDQRITEYRDRNSRALMGETLKDAKVEWRNRLAEGFEGSGGGNGSRSRGRSLQRNLSNVTVPRGPSMVESRTGGAGGGGGAGSGGAGGEGGDEGGAIEAYAPQQDRFSQSSGERYRAALKQLVPANGVLGWDELDCWGGDDGSRFTGDGDSNNNNNQVGFFIEPSRLLEKRLRAARETMSHELAEASSEWKDRMEKQGGSSVTVSRGPSMERRAKTTLPPRYVEDQVTLWVGCGVGDFFFNVVESF